MLCRECVHSFIMWRATRKCDLLMLDCKLFDGPEHIFCFVCEVDIISIIIKKSLAFFVKIIIYKHTIINKKLFHTPSYSHSSPLA